MAVLGTSTCVLTGSSKRFRAVRSVRSFMSQGNRGILGVQESWRRRKLRHADPIHRLGWRPPLLGGVGPILAVKPRCCGPLIPNCKRTLLLPLLLGTWHPRTGLRGPNQRVSHGMSEQSGCWNFGSRQSLLAQLLGRVFGHLLSQAMVNHGGQGTVE